MVDDFGETHAGEVGRDGDGGGGDAKRRFELGDEADTNLARWIGTAPDEIHCCFDLSLPLSSLPWRREVQRERDRERGTKGFS